MKLMNPSFKRIVLVTDAKNLLRDNYQVEMDITKRILQQVAPVEVALLDFEHTMGWTMWAQTHVKQDDLVILDTTRPDGRMWIPSNIHHLLEFSIRPKGANLVLLANTINRDGCHVLVANESGIEGCTEVLDEAFTQDTKPEKCSVRSGSNEQKEFALQMLSNRRLVLTKDWPRIIEAIDRELKERNEKIAQLEKVDSRQPEEVVV